MLMNSLAIFPIHLLKDGAAFIGFKAWVLSIRPGEAFGSLIPPFYIPMDMGKHRKFVNTPLGLRT